MAKKKKGKEEETFDLGIGNVLLGGFFKGIGNLIELAAKVAEKGESIKETGELKGIGKDVKAVYGFTIKTLEGKPLIEHFGNIKETPEGPIVDALREPMVDVFDEDGCVLVVAEMPGVEKEDIRIEIKGDCMNLKTEGKKRKYCKEVTLPSPVDEKTLSLVYKNGIAEIRLGKIKA